MVSKKYAVTFRPKGTKSLFFHREYDNKADAKKRVSQILKQDPSKREMLNPRVSLNPFYKKKK